MTLNLVQNYFTLILNLSWKLLHIYVVMSSYNAVAYIKIVSHYIRILNSYKTTSIYSNFEVVSFDFVSLNKKFKLT